MVQIFSKLLTVFVFLGGVQSSFAREGFNSDIAQAPAAVRKAWDATFYAITDLGTRYQLGTAFLVAKKADSNGTKLFFLTVNHIVNADCVKDKICPNMALSQNAVFLNEKGLRPLSNVGLNLEPVTIIEKSNNPDLALLKVEVSANASNIPEAFQLPDSCEKKKAGTALFTVGFPTAAGRINPDSKPIADKKIIQKRWSEGIYLEYMKSDNNEDDNTNYFVATTVDSLEGNSGGPLFTADFELIGVIKGSSSAPSNGFRYDGNETPGHFDWQTLAIRCEYLKELKDSLSKLN